MVCAVALLGVCGGGQTAAALGVTVAAAGVVSGDSITGSHGGVFDISGALVPGHVVTGAMIEVLVQDDFDPLADTGSRIIGPITLSSTERTFQTGQAPCGTTSGGPFGGSSTVFCPVYRTVIDRDLEYRHITNREDPREIIRLSVGGQVVQRSTSFQGTGTVQTHSSLTTSTASDGARITTRRRHIDEIRRFGGPISLSIALDPQNLAALNANWQILATIAAVMGDARLILARMTATITPGASVSAIPVPASVLYLGTALGLLGFGLRRR